MGNLSQHIRSLAKSSTTPQTLIDIAEDVQELEASLLAHKDQLINAWAEAFWRADVRMDCKHDARYRAEQKYLHYMAHEALNPTSAGGEWLDNLTAQAQEDGDYD